MTQVQNLEKRETATPMAKVRTQRISPPSTHIYTHTNTVPPQFILCPCVNGYSTKNMLEQTGCRL